MVTGDSGAGCQSAPQVNKQRLCMRCHLYWTPFEVDNVKRYVTGFVLILFRMLATVNCSLSAPVAFLPVVFSYFIVLNKQSKFILKFCEPHNRPLSGMHFKATPPSKHL